MSFLVNILGALVSFVAERFFEKRQLEQLQEEKLKAKDDIIKLKQKEAELQAQPLTDKPGIIARLRKYQPKD
jgi:hypothetical protein